MTAIRIIGGEAPVPPELMGAVVAIGNFDGVHRGHQSLLAIAAAAAEQLGAPWGIVTFEPHPRSFFRPLEPVFRLTPLALKTRLVAALGARFVMAVTFDAALASLAPEEFVRLHLHRRLRVRHVVTGYDFHFGKGRKGTPDTMRALGDALGFALTVVDQVTDDNGLAPFSSSSIRDALRHGHLDLAAHELGYRWMVMGEVVEGDRRGRTIGFPTLNIVLDRGAEPYRGIYAVRVRDTGSGEGWDGAGYFGERPTFATGRTFLEVYLFDFDGDLYGRVLTVEFVALIRPDRAFASVDDLVKQMHTDCAAAREALSAAAPLDLSPLGRLQVRGAL